MSFGLFRPSRLPWYIVCIDVMPPMPVPCVLATRLGCTQRISSVGVKPADRNASTVVTRFHSATRSIEFAMSWLTPYTVGSNPVGICAPTVRDSFVLRGTRISVPALRVTCQSPLSGTGAMTVCSGSNSHERAGLGLRRHHEREVLVEEHRNQQRRRVIGIDRAVVDELADADPLDDRVVVALDELALVDQLAGLGVVPARRRDRLPT